MNTSLGRWAIVAFDAATGEMAWTTAGRAAEVERDCVSTALDGTIWAQTSDLTAHELLAIDPDNGAVLRTLPAPASNCSTGLHVLPDDELLYVDFCCSDRAHVVDLDSGTARLLADLDVRNDFLHTSPDGRRAYVVAAGTSPPELVSVAIATGAVLDRLALPAALQHRPMDSSFVRPDGGIVALTEDAIVRVDDDGAGRLTQRWATPVTDDVASGGDVGPRPSSLLPAGPEHELVVGWQHRGADTLLALDAGDGSLRWRAPAREGPSGGVDHPHGLVDADGNVILPQNLDRTTDEGDFLYDVWSPDGAAFGQSPPDIGTETHGMVLGDDGTLYVLTLRDDTPTLVAVAPGPGGFAAIPTTVSPTSVGAGIVTLRVSGPVASARELLLRRGDDTRTAPAVAAVPYSPVDRIGRFDLTDAQLGAWEVLVRTTTGVVVATGATVMVEPADSEAQLFARWSAPSAIRNGRARTLTVTVGNTSNVDADGVPVVVRARLGEDEPFVLTPLFDAVLPDGDGPPEVQQLGGDARFSMVAVHTVPAHGSVSMPYRLAVGEDAPDVGEVELDVAVTHCPSPEGPVFAGVGGDDCFDEAVLSSPAGALDVVSQGAAQCVALQLAELARPRVEDDVIVIPDGPGFTDLVPVARGCYVAATEQILGVSHPVYTIFKAEAFALRLMTAYLDCELGAALAGEGDGHDTTTVRTGTSVDPNELHGPPGAGEPRYLTAAGGMDYRILFENLPDAAFAAQVVEVTQTLDDDLDPGSVALGEFGWGSLSFTPPPVDGAYDTVLVPPGADHRVRMRFTRDGAVLRWRFETLSATAVGPPEDDTIGFLPPNTSPPAGEGFVSYRVDPAADVADGTVVDATASIVFDTNPAIVTNTWSNTFDLVPPSTTLDPVTTPSPANTVPLSWAGEDATSGVASYVVERLTDAGAVTLQPGLEEPAYAVVGRRGDVLDVRVRAVDGAGNVEPADSAPVAHVEIARDALDRLFGVTRIETAIDISRRVFPSSGVVVLARHDTYPDSLAGATVAHSLAAPILLTPTDALPEVVADEIRRLGARNAVILGGTAAVSDAVVQTLGTMGVEVTRAAGPNRYGTAADIASTLPAAERAFVVEGAHADDTRGWPEALVVAPWAAQVGEPLLLVEADRLPSETADAIRDLGVQRVTIVGGEEQVGAAVAQELAGLGVDVERIGSDDRYVTGLAVAEAADAAGVGSRDATWLATGRVFADALSAGAAVAATGGRLLLIDGVDPATSQAVLEDVRRHEGAIGVLRLVGGTVAISADAEAQVRAALAG